MNKRYKLQDSWENVCNRFDECIDEEDYKKWFQDDLEFLIEDFFKCID